MHRSTILVEAPAVVVGTQTFVTSISGGTTRAGSYWLGFKGQVGSQGLDVTALGRWIMAGHNQRHQLNLLDASGTLLGLVPVDSTLGAPNTFLFGPLINPVWLPAGSQFYLVSYEGGIDNWMNADFTFSVTPDATVQSSAYMDTGSNGIGIPNLDVPGKIYVPTNFQYDFTQYTGPTSFLTSILQGAWRTDTFDAGFKGQVGSKDITVSALGRLFVTPDTQPHTVKLLKADGTLLASVSVPVLSGVISFANLATPVTLVAGQPFFLMSSEPGGSEQWSDDNVTFTNTADASVVSSAYMNYGTAGTGAMPNLWQSGHMYVGLSFKYT